MIRSVSICLCLNRVNSTSLFKNATVCTDDTCDASELELDMDRCKCVKNGESFGIKCGETIMEYNSVNNDDMNDITGQTEQAARGRRDIIYSDDIIYLYDLEEPQGKSFIWRKKRTVEMKMSLQNATDYCKETILNTAAAEVCLEITGVNASSAIQSCIADLQVSCNDG